MLHAMLTNQIHCFLVFNLHYQNKFHKYEVKLTVIFNSTVKNKMAHTLMNNSNVCKEKQKQKI